MTDPSKPRPTPTVTGYRRRALRSAMFAIAGHYRQQQILADVEAAIARGAEPLSAIATAMADAGMFGEGGG